MQQSDQFVGSLLTRGALWLALRVAPRDPVVRRALTFTVVRWYCRELQAMEFYAWQGEEVTLRPFKLSHDERRRKGGWRFATAIAIVHTAASNPGVVLCGLLATFCLPVLYIGLGVGHLAHLFLKWLG